MDDDLDDLERELLRFLLLRRQGKGLGESGEERVRKILARDVASTVDLATVTRTRIDRLRQVVRQKILEADEDEVIVGLAECLDRLKTLRQKAASESDINWTPSESKAMQKLKNAKKELDDEMKLFDDALKSAASAQEFLDTLTGVLDAVTKLLKSAAKKS